MAGRCKLSAIFQVSISETISPHGGVGLTRIDNVASNPTLTIPWTLVALRPNSRAAPGYRARFERIAPAVRASCGADAGPSGRRGSGAEARPTSQTLQRATTLVRAGRSTASR